MDNAKYLFNQIKNIQITRKYQSKPTQIYLNGPMIMTRFCDLSSIPLVCAETFGFIATTLSDYGPTDIRRFSVGLESINLLDEFAAQIKEKSELKFQ